MTTQTPIKPTVSATAPRPEGRTPRPTHTAPFAPSAFYPPDQPAPVPREPGLTDPHHRLLQTLTSPEVSTITLCEIHTLTLAQIAELTGSETFEGALAAAERIAQFRLRLLKLEAEQLAWARLTDLARRHPVTPGEQETSRKAAAQILRETKKPAPASPGLRGGAGEVPERSGEGGGLGTKRSARGKPADEHHEPHETIQNTCAPAAHDNAAPSTNSAGPGRHPCRGERPQAVENRGLRSAPPAATGRPPPGATRPDPHAWPPTERARSVSDGVAHQPRASATGDPQRD